MKLNLTQIFIISSLILLIASCAFSLFRKQESADISAGVALLFIVLTWLSSFYDLHGHVNKVRNLQSQWIFAIIASFYIFSSFVRFGPDEGWYLTWPKVYGGDEEHYLIMINSLLNDYDLELRNNYENARRGGLDAGISWRGRNLDPHANFISKDKKKRFYIPDTIDVGARFEKYVILPGYEAIHKDRENYYVRPHHPPGMPVVLSIFLWPFRGWKYIESVAIGLITLFSIIGLWILYKVIATVCENKRCVDISIFLIALGTPLYHYSLLLFKEVFLAFVLTLSCWLFFCKRQGFYAGLFVVLGCFTRYSIPVVTIPMFLYGLMKREWRILIGFSIALGLGAIGLVTYNAYMYEGPFYFSQMQFGRFLSVKTILFIFLCIPLLLIGLYFLFRALKISRFINKNTRLINMIAFFIGVIVLSILFTKNRYIRAFILDLKIGLIPFAPILIFSFLKILDVRLWRDSMVAGILGVVIVYFGIYIARGYAVGSAYSSREFIPIIPLMALPLCCWVKDNKNKLLGIIFSVLATYSFLINFLASIARKYFWHLPLDHALSELLQRIFGA